jgi:hypothetical protein
MTNETEPTEIIVDFETWQAIQDFEAMIKCAGTQTLIDQWSALKKELRRNLQITLPTSILKSIGSFAPGPPPPPPWPYD